MSFDLQLHRFFERAPATADRAKVRSVVADARGRIEIDHWQKELVGDICRVQFADGGAVELRMPREDAFVGLGISCFQLTPQVVDFVYTIARCDDLVLSNLQGAGSPQNPSLIMFDESQRQHLPADTYRAPVVAESVAKLGELLQPSGAEWSAYRDQVMKSIERDETPLADITSFFDLVTDVLPPTVRHGLWERVVSLSDRHGAVVALHEAFATFDQEPHRLFLQVDARDDGEVVWQANALARTHGIEETFDWQPDAALPYRQVLNALIAFDAWLKPRGHSFMMWNNSKQGPLDDTYAGLIAPRSAVRELERAATEGRMNCYALRAIHDTAAGFVLVDLLPSGSSLPRAIQVEINSHRPELKPYAMFTASWCEPCRTLIGVLAGSEMQAILHGRLLIMIDFDVWGDSFESVATKVSSVPCIAELLADGTATDRIIGGDAWEADTEANIVRALRPFFDVR